MLAQLATEAGMPPGVLSVVHGASPHLLIVTNRYQSSRDRSTCCYMLLSAVRVLALLHCLGPHWLALRAGAVDCVNFICDAPEIQARSSSISSSHYSLPACLPSSIFASHSIDSFSLMHVPYFSCNCVPTTGHLLCGFQHRR